jgi:hypothetical protein
VSSSSTSQNERGKSPEVRNAREPPASVVHPEPDVGADPGDEQDQENRQVRRDALDAEQAVVPEVDGDVGCGQDRDDVEHQQVSTTQPRGELGQGTTDELPLVGTVECPDLRPNRGQRRCRELGASGAADCQRGTPNPITR